MTRRSKRELERALDEVDGEASTTREWAEAYLEGALTDGFDYTVGIGDDADPDGVCILADDYYTIHAPRDEVPGWIKIERNLPVETR